MRSSARSAIRASAFVVALATSIVAGAAAKAPTAPTLATIKVGGEATPAERLLDGTVEAVHEALISAQTAGRVASIEADVNDHVTAGQVLLRLRSTEQVAGLGQAQAALKEASARETQAQEQYARIQDMYQRKVVAKATFDEASAARDAAVARLAAARAGVAAAQEGVAYTELRAPYAGVVTGKRVQVGEAVGPGTPLVTVASLEALRVVVEIPQALIAQVRAAKKAAVYFNGQRIESSGITLFPAADPRTGTFRARVDLPSGIAGVAPGMYVKAGFVTGEASRLMVPRASVVERSEMRALYVVGPDGRVSLRQVRLGHEYGDRIEVLAGLAKGEAVALDPAAAGLLARQGSGQQKKND
ncbi:MAG TPA: efflux RND transporter periplasmic adaptor subunit [Steroidobacteraceae bacterium]|nr:efflux RND transporter periplasmic adaptor subunit [Steroidobacteraceae bacterium]